MKSMLAAVVLAGTLAAFAQPPAQIQKRPITFADLQAMKRVSDPQISPSGKWVMFSVTDVSLEKNTKTNHLWIVPLAGGKEVQLTTGDGESNGRFAPDGKTISLTMKDQIFEMSFDDAAGKVGAPIQVTGVNGGADGAIWSPDGKRLMFVVNVFPECSDRPIWVEEDDCDIAKQKADDASPVKAQIWTHLLYRHWNAWTGERRSHIAVVDSDSGRHLRDLTPRSVVGDAETPTFSLGGPLGYAWAPDSHEIAYVTNLEVGLATPTSAMQPGESTNNDIFTLKLDEPNAKATKVSTSLGSDDGPQYSSDGKYLAWRSQARNGYESDKLRLIVWDRDQKATRELMPKFDGWIDEFVWVPDSAAIVFTTAQEGEEAILSCDLLAPEKRGENPTIAGLSSAGEYSDIRVFQKKMGSGDVQIVASKMTISSPAEIVAINAGMLGHTFYDISTIALPGMKFKDPKVSGELIEEEQVTSDQEKSLTHLNESILSNLALSPLAYFWFPGANGTKVQGFIVKPPNFDPAKKYPLKFLIHGGPQGAWGDAWSYRWNPELFAANGYVVVMINPRGSTGYGQKFLEQVSGDWGGRPYIDLMKGLDYAEAHYPFIDKTRECALGASYGGYMADWVLTHTHRFACIVTHDGMFNPESAFGDTEELWFNEWEFRPLASAASDAVITTTAPAHPWDFYNLSASQDPFRKWSPMQNIKFAKTPTLVVHSQRDYRLDVSEGMQLFTALQLLHVPSKMLYFPDEGHWVLKPQNSQLWYQTVNDWVDQWTHTNAYAK